MPSFATHYKKTELSTPLPAEKLTMPSLTVENFIFILTWEFSLASCLRRDSSCAELPTLSKWRASVPARDPGCGSLEAVISLTSAGAQASSVASDCAMRILFQLRGNFRVHV
jgi:hypothetical protein